MDTDLSYSTVLDKMVADGQVVGMDGEVMAPTGLASRNSLLILRNLCISLKSKRTLEVGLAFGSSALTFAQCHADLGRAPSGQHVAMDPFQQDMRDAGLAQLQRAGQSDYVAFFREPSHQVLPRLLEGPDRFDLCFIDGSHLFEDCFLDAFYCARLLNVGGVVVFDDASDPHVAKVTRFVEGNMSQSMQPYNLAPFRPNVSIKFRLARALGRSQLKAFRKIGDPVRPWNSQLLRF